MKQILRMWYGNRKVLRYGDVTVEQTKEIVHNGNLGGGVEGACLRHFAQE